MHFQHSGDVWRDFPALVPGVLYAEGITTDVPAGSRADGYAAVAKSRLAESAESELPEIQAWRRAFTRMGLKPTQYRCASEALLRRFRKEGCLPLLHPLVDLCNAASLAFAWYAPGPLCAWRRSAYEALGGHNPSRDIVSQMRDCGMIIVSITEVSPARAPRMT